MGNACVLIIDTHGCPLVSNRPSFPVAILFLASLVLSGEPSALAEANAQPSHILPGSGLLRMAYYYPPDSVSLDSLRANVRRLDIVAPHWLEIDDSGEVRASEVRDKIASVLVIAQIKL